MPVKPGFWTGAQRGLSFFEDVVMMRLRKKLEDQMAEKNASRKHFMDQADAKDKADREKADREDVNKQTELATKAGIDRQKQAIEADINSDDTLDPGVKKRALALTALGTSEGLATAQSLVETARKPVKTDKAAELKDQIAQLGGWTKASKTNPELVAKAEVYGVVPPKAEKAEKVDKSDQPPSAQEMIDAALAHVKGQKASAQAIEAKLIAERVPAEKARAIAVRIAGLEPDERKAGIKFLQSMYGKKNPPVADSLIADWSQPGDFEMPIDPNASPLDGKLGTATGKPGGPAAAAVEPVATKPGTQQGAPTGKPANNAGTGEVSKEREMSLYEKERELDLILQKLREELAE